MEKSTIYFEENENKPMRTIEITHMFEIMDCPRFTEKFDLTEFIKYEKSMSFENDCVFFKEKVSVPESDFKRTITLKDIRNKIGAIALGVRQNSKTNCDPKNDKIEVLALKIEDLLDELIDLCENEV